jgi:hypothetical protein
MTPRNAHARKELIGHEASQPAKKPRRKSASRVAPRCPSRSVATRRDRNPLLPRPRGRDPCYVRAGRSVDDSMACMLGCSCSSAAGCCPCSGLAAGAGSLAVSSCQPPLAAYAWPAGNSARARAPCRETAPRAPAEPAPFLGLSLGASGPGELVAGARMFRSSCSSLGEAGNGSIRIVSRDPVVSRAEHTLSVSCRRHL